jgi:hypothetical protein
MDDCQNVDLVERYIAGNCSARERRTVEVHAAQCTECQERLRSAQANKTAHERPDSASPHQSSAGNFTKTLPVHPDESNDRPIGERSTASSDTKIPDQALGSMFQGYQIIKELPRGGQAIVYEAIHKATKMKVALKVLLPGLLASAKARRYFEQEVALAARLKHPNIVSIRDSGIAQGQYIRSLATTWFPREGNALQQDMRRDGPCTSAWCYS